MVWSSEQVHTWPLTNAMQLILSLCASFDLINFCVYKGTVRHCRQNRVHNVHTLALKVTTLVPAATHSTSSSITIDVTGPKLTGIFLILASVYREI